MCVIMGQGFVYTTVSSVIERTLLPQTRWMLVFISGVILTYNILLAGRCSVFCFFGFFETQIALGWDMYVERDWENIRGGDDSFHKEMKLHEYIQGLFSLSHYTCFSQLTYSRNLCLANDNPLWDGAAFAKSASAALFIQPCTAQLMGRCSPWKRMNKNQWHSRSPIGPHDLHSHPHFHTQLLVVFSGRCDSNGQREVDGHPEIQMSFRVGSLSRTSWLAQVIVVNSLCIPFLALDFWCCLYNFTFCLLKLWDDVIFSK